MNFARKTVSLLLLAATGTAAQAQSERTRERVKAEYAEAVRTGDVIPAGDRQAPKFELRFRSLFKPGAGYAFPCDVDGHVDLDALSEAGRNHYFFARTVVGSELTMPTVDRAVTA